MIKHEGSGMCEASITVNGRLLSFAESMSVRVAIGSMRIGLSSKSYQKAIGEALANGYDSALSDVEQMIIADCK